MPSSSQLFHVHESVLTASWQTFRATRGVLRRHEGIVYWCGKQCRGDWIVTTCIAPYAYTTPGSFETSASDNAKVITALNAAGLELVAQVHSHPGGSVGHSNGDSRGALMPYEGFLSIIAPDYGCGPIWPLTHCGVHRFESGRFRRFTTAQVEASFRLIPGFIDLRK
jgi:proteasome lid subunit RPN8/RPN11